MKYGFSDDAIVDLDEICDYLGSRNVSAASRLFDQIRQKAKLVASFPNSGKPYDHLIPGLRGFIVNDYELSVAIKISDRHLNWIEIRSVISPACFRDEDPSSKHLAQGTIAQ
jgi:plasmid stabilization system protein ParE